MSIHSPPNRCPQPWGNVRVQGSNPVSVHGSPLASHERGPLRSKTHANNQYLLQAHTSRFRWPSEGARSYSRSAARNGDSCARTRASRERPTPPQTGLACAHSNTTQSVPSRWSSMSPIAHLVLGDGRGLRLRGGAVERPGGRRHHASERLGNGHHRSRCSAQRQIGIERKHIAGSQALAQIKSSDQGRGTRPAHVTRHARLGFQPSGPSMTKRTKPSSQKEQVWEVCGVLGGLCAMSGTFLPSHVRLAIFESGIPDFRAPLADPCRMAPWLPMAGRPLGRSIGCDIAQL